MSAPQHTHPEWWSDHRERAALWSWLVEQGWQPSDPLDFIAKPWHWAEEHALMCAERREATVQS